MALSYWGWKGTQANTANALKPDPDDRNVSPEEMAAYARKVGLGAEVRVGGTLERVKDLIAAGFPVILETSLLLPEKGWEGHYTLLTGYSDERAQFTSQDSLRGPNYVQAYPDVEREWRAFNYLYIVLFAPERLAEVLAALGPDADPQVSLGQAAEIARRETGTLSAQDLAFAWFNLGTSLTVAGDWAGAAAAYDAARQVGLPWRMLWYQHGPLEAYFQAGRYPDVIALAEATLAQADGLEEVYFWRGRARLAQGDQAGAVADWRAAARFNRNYTAPALALGELGLTSEQP
jgi:tetratricopeptide (TPR) repeat protein